MHSDTLGRIYAIFDKFEEDTGIKVHYNELVGRPQFICKIRRRSNGMLAVHSQAGGRAVAVAATREELSAELRKLLNKYLSRADQKAIWKDFKLAQGQQYS